MRNEKKKKKKKFVFDNVYLYLCMYECPYIKKIYAFLQICIYTYLYLFIYIYARKRINFMKLICAQPWGKNPNTMVKLTTALIRSKLTYGQEIYHSAPKTYLNKLQSIDSRGIKLALGLPISTNTLKCYKEVNLLSLDEQRKLATSNYFIRSQQVENSVTSEICIDSDTSFPRQSRKTSYLTPIYNYTKDVFESCNINPLDVQKMPIVPSIPPWEHLSATFDYEYANIHKSDNINLLAIEAKEHISNNYQNHLKIYTDGSVLDSNDCGSAFSIPDLNLHKSYYLGKGLSIFTCELYAILFALQLLMDMTTNILNIVICVDSRSVLQSLQSWDCGVRTDLVFEIKYLIHLLRLRNLGIVLCWVPSHCGIYWNDYVDKLAKRGANNQYPSKTCYSTISYNEFKTKIKTNFKSNTKVTISPLYLPKRISTLLLKLRLNTWRTKFNKEIKCSCGEEISIQHILFECKDLIDKYKEKDINIESYNNMNELLHDRQILNIIDILLYIWVILRRSFCYKKE